MPLLYAPSDFRISHQLPRRSWLGPTQLVSFALLIAVVVLQILRPPVVPVERSWEHATAYQGSREPPTCPNTVIFEEPLPVSRPHKMSLIEEAKRVAAEFEYSPDDVNRGVKAFMSQMRESKPLASLSLEMLRLLQTRVCKSQEQP